MTNYKKISLSILTLCVSQQLYAAPTTAGSEVDLGSTVVNAEVKTGMALAQKISEMPAVTQVIFEEEIAQQATGNRTVSDILGQLIPSLGTGSGSTSNYATTMQGRPVQFLLNGIPLTGSRNISRQLNSISASQLERVEVLSGSTSIYGAGATGGLINLVTKSGNDNSGFNGQSRIGIDSSRKFEGESAGFTVGQTLGYVNDADTVNARLDVDYTAKAGKYDAQDERIMPDINQTDQQDTNTLSVNANLGLQLTDSQSINLAATHYDNQQDSEYAPDFSPSIVGVLTGKAKPSMKAVKGAKLEVQPFTTKNSLSVNYHNDDVAGSTLNVTGYYRDEHGAFYPRASLFKGKGVVLQSEAEIDVKGVRVAMQTPIKLSETKEALVSYGADYEIEHDEQTYYGNDVNTFLGTNGLVVTRNGKEYVGGPETDVTKTSAFINAEVDLTQKLHASAGVRHQNIKADVQPFVTRKTKIISELFGAPIKEVAGGEAENSKTLFNLGASLNVTKNSEVFANFSQGFTFSDVQRGLRDAESDFVLTDASVEPVTVDSYDLGWNLSNAKTSAKITGFYNESDKTVEFDNQTVKVLDADERVYGAAASFSHNLNDSWSIGSTVAYTEGQSKDAEGEWKELNATRITPLKGTTFAQYNFEGGSSVRLQTTAIGGTDKAYKEDAKSQPVKGYVTADLLGRVDFGNSRFDYGVYNLTNTDYQTVYHQTTYRNLNRLNAKGTTYGIKFTVDY